MLPLPRPAKIPAELPLPILDVVRRDDGEFVGTELTESEEEEIEVHELASWAKANCLPASPTAGTSSRIPTTSSGESWEVLDSTASSPVARCKTLLAELNSAVKRDQGPYLPLSHWEGLGYPSETIIKGWTSAKAIPGHGVCYQYYIGDDESMDEFRLLDNLIHGSPRERQTPSSSSTQLPPATAETAVMFKSPPTPPLNPHPVNLAPKQPPVKLEPKQPPLNPHSPPPPTKAAPKCLGVPPKPMGPPAKAPPDYAPTPRPPKMWKKKTVREVKCERCGHGNILHQFM